MPAARTASRPMTPLEWGLLLFLSVLWGGSFFFNAIALEELPTFVIAGSRVALAAVVLWLLLPIAGVRMPRDGRIWAAFFAMGLINNAIPMSLLVWGQSHIASGVASILNATTPLFAVVIAHAFTTDEKMTGGRLAGVLIGFLGVAVMIGSDASSTFGVHVAAELACLGAAISYACAGVFGRRFRAMGVPALATATGQITASSALLLPLALILDRPWTLPAPSGSTVLALLGLAVLSTALGYILYFRILATAGATNITLVTFLIPASAILLGVLALGETLHPKHVVGMVLIGLGLAAIDGRPWRALIRRLAPAAAPPRAHRLRAQRIDDRT